MVGDHLTSKGVKNSMKTKIVNALTALSGVASVAAYNATYVADDVDDIVIDGLGAFLVVLVSFATLIGLVFLARRMGWKGFGK